jgi:hypothetical protein
MHRADQRHGDGAAGIDGVGVGEAFLAIDYDAQPVAGIEPVGGIVSHRHRNWHRRRINRRSIGTPGRCGKAGAERADGAAGRSDDARWGIISLAVGQRIEVALRLHHGDRRGPAHAARQSKRGQKTDENGAQASHRTIQDKY